MMGTEVTSNFDLFKAFVNNSLNSGPISIGLLFSIVVGKVFIMSEFMTSLISVSRICDPTTCIMACSLVGRSLVKNTLVLSDSFSS